MREERMVPIVFLPGAGGRASFWAPVAERLRHLAPQVLVGWPGFGDEPLVPGFGSLDDLFRWLRGRLPSGPVHVVAQSMGGVVALRLALEEPGRVASLVLAATSGGVNAAALGGTDWRAEYRAELPNVPDWFERDVTDLTDRLHLISAPTLILYGDADPICPQAIAELLERRIGSARVVRVHGGTHTFAQERPGEVALAIEAHLTSLAAGGPRATRLGS